jgi:hypothetical protein
MNLSNDTLNVLKNFATINPNVVFKPGQKLKTISESKTILASATIVEDFPQEFGVYDLNEFLSVLNLIDNPTLDFEEKAVLVTGGGQKIILFRKRYPNYTSKRYSDARSRAWCFY